MTSRTLKTYFLKPLIIFHLLSPVTANADILVPMPVIIGALKEKASALLKPQTLVPVTGIRSETVVL